VMMGFARSSTRRTFVGGMLLLPALAGIVSTTALADGSKTLQSAVQYQTKPNGDKQCSKCTFFLPGQTADADGTCKLVAGTISPSGYCVAYNPR
jgi:High potential iron-sulfur protein